MTATSAYIVSVINSIDWLVNIAFFAVLVVTIAGAWFTANCPENEREWSLKHLHRAFFYLLCLAALMCFIPDKKTLNLMFDVPTQCSEVTK